ncbi:hypothetical protein H2200_000490 [Cladophialophora chaetospira]|uniref:Lipoprotein n=1 Tax=Cladophialophora chaetospira TaxID=386627 RepID=A0AA38XNW0_9EURO|nr:hypothetical protein H2200_000490 [Cladophialophora chaetospira]
MKLSFVLIGTATLPLLLLLVIGCKQAQKTNFESIAGKQGFDHNNYDETSKHHDETSKHHDETSKHHDETSKHHNNHN